MLGTPETVAPPRAENVPGKSEAEKTVTDDCGGFVGRFRWKRSNFSVFFSREPRTRSRRNTYAIGVAAAAIHALDVSMKTIFKCDAIVSWLRGKKKF